MDYEYRVAGLRVLCRLPFPLTITAESREFLYPSSGETDADVIFSLQAAPMLTPPTQAHKLSCRLYAADCVYFCLQKGAAPFACVHRKESTPIVLEAKYLQGMEAELRYSSNLCDLLSLETLLLLHDGFLLHASFLDIGGSALLFSAPSGTGKSTQADLWQMHANARIINGDRAALRLRDGTWYACGLPYAGSSQICHDATLPCRAIVVLRQAKENRLTRLSAREAMLALYPEMSVHEWEKPQVERAASLLLQLLQEIPVYRLDCQPNEAAVRLLSKEILP